MTSDLKQLQQIFIQNIIGSTQEHIEPPEQLEYPEPLQQLQQPGAVIYQNNYQMNLIKTLALTYPVCEQLVGKPFFKALAKHYIFDNPSKHQNLNDYGNTFAAFLQDFPGVKDLSYLAYLSFVAELEWAISRVEIGVNDSVFDWSLLASVPVDKQIELVLHRRQNAKLLYAPYPIDRIWQTNQPGFVGDDIVDLAEGEVYLFIYRSDDDNYDIRIDRLSSLDWEILSKIDGRTSLGELWAKFESEIVSSINAIEARLPYYIKRGFISCFSLSE